MEQNLATITLPLITALYLGRTDGWETVGVDKKAEALGYIKRGQRQTDGQLMLRILVSFKKHINKNIKNIYILTIFLKCLSLCSQAMKTN